MEFFHSRIAQCFYVGENTLRIKEAHFKSNDHYDFISYQYAASVPCQVY